MTDVGNSFEGGTNGTTLTTGNTGGASGDAFNTVSVGGATPFVFDNTRAAHGSLSLKVAPVASSTTYAEWSTAVGTQTEFWGRAYIYMTSNPASTWIAYRVQTSGTNVARIAVTTAGKIRLDGGSGNTTLFTATGSLTLNAWNRVEWHILTSTTVGQFDVRIFRTSPDGTTADESSALAATQNLGANATQYQFGGLQNSATPSGTFWLDDLAVSTVGWIGPAVTNGSVTAVVATAAAVAPAPVVTGVQNATVVAVVATATAAAPAPVATGGAVIVGVSATVTALGQAPVVVAGALVSGVVAVGTALAAPPVVTGVRHATVVGVVATATTVAPVPVVSTGTTNDFYATSEGFTNGGTVTTGAGLEWTSKSVPGTSSIVYDNQYPADGSLSLLFTTAANDASYLQQTPPSGTSAGFAIRAKFTAAAAPANTTSILQVRNSSNVAMGNLSITSTGFMQISNTTGGGAITGAVTVPMGLGTQVQFRLWVKKGTTTSDGEIHAEMWSGGTLLESLNSTAMNTTILDAATWRVGRTGTTVSAWTFRLDTILMQNNATGHAPLAEGSVTGVAATAAAVAPAPALTGGATVTGVVATGTATAAAPVVSGGTVSANVNAVTATATTAAAAPVVVAGASVTGVAATATATAPAPAVTGVRDATVTGVVATATTTASAPTVGATASGTVTATVATATAAATAPAASGDALIVAVVATVTVDAPAPTVTATQNAEVIAVTATAIATARTPTVSDGTPTGPRLDPNLTFSNPGPAWSFTTTSSAWAFNSPGPTWILTEAR